MHEYKGLPFAAKGGETRLECISCRSRRDRELFEWHLEFRSLTALAGGLRLYNEAQFGLSASLSALPSPTILASLGPDDSHRNNPCSSSLPSSPCNNDIIHQQQRELLQQHQPEHYHHLPILLHGNDQVVIRHRPSVVGAMDAAERIRRRQRTNIIVARFIPAFLTAVTIYSSYVFVGPLCVNYLINSPTNIDVPPRIALGIALPIVFFFLLILMASCYIRLLYIVTFDPGYIPKTIAEEADNKPAAAVKKTWHSCAPTTISDGQDLFQLDYNGIVRREVEAPPGLEDFYTKDAFVCDRNGLPHWCHVCGNWKADRVHHSRDVGRCVTKMDHFCPWVGGMVGENGFKFFVQFNFYTALFALYTMVVMAVFVAEAQRKTGTVGDVQWVVVMGFGGFFALFTFGLAMTSMHLAIRNVSTVENIDVGNRVMYLAVLLPPAFQESTTPPSQQHEASHSRSGESQQPLTSEIDDPLHQSYFSSEKTSRRRKSQDDLAASIWQGTITYPLTLAHERPAQAQRTFAILKTSPGMNPWHIGVFNNLCAVFGNTPAAWLLPYRRSPCTDHSSNISRYPLGWEFEQLLSDARLVQPPEFVKRFGESDLSSAARRKKKRKLAEGWQHGERPDGWTVNKHIKRIQREQRQTPLSNDGM